MPNAIYLVTRGFFIPIEYFAKESVVCCQVIS